MFMKKKNVQIMQYNSHEIYAPISGQFTPLENVNDEVFKNKMMGDGIAIQPSDGSLYAPISGEVTVVFPTQHVIGIESEDGIKIIIHVGIDTVRLKGNGFSPVVSVGQKVHAGDLLMNFKLNKMAKEYDMTTMLVIENYQDYNMTIHQHSSFNAGEAVIRIERNSV